MEKNDILIFEDIVNRHFKKKYDWFNHLKISDLKVGSLYYELIIFGDIFIDYEWGIKQFEEYSVYSDFPTQDEEFKFGYLLDNKTDTEVGKNLIKLFEIITGVRFSDCNMANIDVNLVGRNNINEVMKNKIKGGKGDKITPQKISKLFDVPVFYVEKQIKKGIKVEMEHTNNVDIAREIVLDHLTEFPDYYDRLEQMEKQGKEDFKLKETIKRILSLL
jgi:hypothetical protein